jgi:cell division transport system permease protein
MSALSDTPTPTSESQAIDTASLELKRNMPLVPAESIAGRALVTVIAIMTFLASLTAGAAFLIAGASQDWRSALGQEMTIQVRPAPGRDLDTDVKKAAAVAAAARGIADVRIFSKEESERLLEPWLGKGLDLSELPVPRLIVVRRASGGGLDTSGLRDALEAVPGASLDDHHLWLERLAAMADTIVIAAIVIFLLVLVAMALAVAFATRGAMAGNRGIVDVLHFVGAEDRFIAGQFQMHFLRLGLRGGLLGGGSAILVFLAAGLLSRFWLATPGGDQIEAFFGSFALGPKGYGAIFLIAVGIAVLTGLMSRSIVFRHLQSLH